MRPLVTMIVIIAVVNKQICCEPTHPQAHSYLRLQPKLRVEASSSSMLLNSRLHLIIHPVGVCLSSYSHGASIGYYTAHAY